MAELKKCPFCGSEVKIIAEQIDARTVAYEFRCQNLDCCSMTSFDYCDREEAIEAWNNRVTEAEIRASAIDEFAKEIEAEYDNDACPNVADYLDYKISLRDLFRIAEQLKEE